MKNNCVKCEAQRITQESRDKGPDEINQNLLSDLFDLVYLLYGEFRGVGSRTDTWYVDRNRVLGVVGAAIDKAEIQAVDAWREEQRKQRKHYEQRNHGED